MATAVWDLPPPIASPAGREWKSRPVHWRTPQRIATLNAGETTTCHPILVSERYLVVAGTGFVSLFSLEEVNLGLNVKSTSTLTAASISEHPYWKHQSPTVRLDLDDNVSIIQLLDSTNGDDLEQDNGGNRDMDAPSSHLIFALSEAGNVYQLNIVTPDAKSTDDDDPSSDADATVELICVNSWNTGTFGPSCFHALHWGEDYPSYLSMVIGYESGHLEGWRVSNNNDSKTPSSTPKGSPQRKASQRTSPNKGNIPAGGRGITKSRSKSAEDEIMTRDSILDFTLQWRGYLHRAPIRSLTALGRQTDVIKEEFERDQRTDVKTNLVLTMEIPENNPEIKGTASMVDVLKIDFKLLRVKFISNNRRSIQLFPYLQMPSCGMELVDSSTVGGTTIEGESFAEHVNALEHFPKRLSMLPSQGTDSSISLSDGRQCGVSLSDGTVAILSSDTEFGLSSSSWGIVKDAHQLILSYPAIGCGRIHQKQHYTNADGQDEDETNNRKEYIACCLRGGTCFLIPVVDGDAHHDIAAIPYLHDVDADWTSVYIQGFTAGDLDVKTINGRRSLPVMVYALAGGTLDVYTCGLIHPLTPDVEKAVDDAENRECLTDLLQGGALSMVSDLLERMNGDENDPLWADPLWKATHKAFQSSKVLPAAMTIDQIQSPTFESFKNLLLTLAN